jgi:cell surface protein SprA
LNWSKGFSVLTVLLTLLFLGGIGTAFAQNKDTTAAKKKNTALANKLDTITLNYNDSLPFPLQDRRGDWITWRNTNPFDISDTAIINQNIVYDPVSNEYFIYERVGNHIYREPTYLTFNEFYDIQNHNDEVQYFKDRADIMMDLNKKLSRPKHNVYTSLFDRIFGAGDSLPNGKKDSSALKKLNSLTNKDSLASNVTKKLEQALKVDIKPQGSVDIMMGYQGQKTLNPTLPESARKSGGFDFNMNTNFNVNATIGNKLKLPLSYNTLANFDYLNQLKLDYKGKDDEIIKSINAGNMSWQSRGTLLPSYQNLFGLKTQLQFGRLFITAALAEQRSQTQTQSLKGGATTSNFNLKLDDYDENRNFLLAQYFKDNWSKAYATLPVVGSQVQIQRIEVWITNHTGATTSARFVAGLMDLGESNPYNPSNAGGTPGTYPDNGSNGLYSKVVSGGLQSAFRAPATVNAQLQGINLKPVNDYEVTYARELSSNEFYLNPQTGFISLNAQLQPSDVLAVAYQYTANGRVYQVGEFAEDIGLDTATNAGTDSAAAGGVQQVLFLKLLKATAVRTSLPIWDLMMKNVYSLGVTGLSQKDFKLNIFYNDPSGGQKIYLPECAPAVSGEPILKVLGLDRLNSRGDPQPDGVFDYIEGFTVLSQQGKIIFPELQPFGRDLQTLAYTGTTSALQNKYIFYQLYDSIKVIALTNTNLDHFVSSGTATATGGSEIYLGAFNIPQGSVKVSAGGQQLVEGTDFVVDYNLGSVKILNQSILNSGVPVNVSFENNANIGVQQKGFVGLRAEYIFNKKLSVGLSMAKLKERPYYTKVDYGQDPINNTVYGTDLNYKSEVPAITRLLGRLPNYSPKAKSFLTTSVEAAYLKPGHPKQIGSGGNGLVYLDDFEGSTSNLDLRFPLTAWALASTPTSQLNPAQALPLRFPESELNDSVTYGFNRAKIAWYNIEPNLQDPNSPTNPIKNYPNAATVLSDPRTRLVYTNELFPLQTTNITNTQTTTFDIAYYPQELGPYNYETSNAEINANGRFVNPSTKWGGLMRALDQTDFITNNFQYIEFWVQDPFVLNPNSSGGKLFINLGDVSEDILKDGKRLYENGLNTPNLPAAVDSSSVWGTTPLNPIQITQAFSNNPSDRVYQDVGFDGLSDSAEIIKRSSYLASIKSALSVSAYNAIKNDPSHDDYKWYRDSSYDNAQTPILGRYKNYNGPDGNSPVVSGSSTFAPAATLYPDDEDINHDNTLNQTEQYFEYEIDLAPGMPNNPFVAQRDTIPITYVNGTTGNETWYLFRVPIQNYTSNVGQIPDFQSIRFMRMYMTGFQDSTVLRFATLNLVRNQWRPYTYNLDTNGVAVPLDSIAGSNSTTFNTIAVNLQENSERKPVNYIIPPGIERVQQLSNNGVNILQNEQSMSLQISNLRPGDARADIKTTNLDLRSYGRLSMFAHAESVTGLTAISNGNLNLVVRIGQDFTNNFYEIKVPLQVTQPGNYTDPTIVWPPANNLDFNLQDLINFKLLRDKKGLSLTSIFRDTLPGDPKTYSILGNPNFAQVQGIMIGVQNASNNTVSAEVWVDELRLSEINDKPAWAAVGKMDVQLADLGKLSLSAGHYSQGWGTIEQHTNERAKDNLTQLNAAMTIEAAKLLPKKFGVSIPVYASINKNIITPEYDPYDQDVTYKYKLSQATSKEQRDSIKRASLDQTTITTLNFTNMRFLPKGKPHLWSISNFDASVSYTHTSQTSPTILFNDISKYKVNVGYTYNNTTKYKEPFKKIMKNASPWFSFLKDFNFNLKPSLIGVRADINRQFGQFTPRIVNTDTIAGGSQTLRVDTTYDKYFTFDRIYNLRWDLTRSINLDFNATNNAYVDEPDGVLNTKEKRDSMWNNFLKGGRTTKYLQKTTANYTLPLSKFPALDFLTARYSYGTSYDWIAGSLVAISLGEKLGNTIENSQTNTFSGEIDLTKLYNKNRWLKAVNALSANKNNPTAKNRPNQTPGLSNNPNNAPGIVVKTREEVITDKNGFLLTGAKKREALSEWRKQKRDLKEAERLRAFNMPVHLNDFERITGRFLTMVKRISINYSENYMSRVPGYMDSTRFLGQDWRSMEPGLDYAFGKQPNGNWLAQKAALGLISTDSNFNSLYRQNFAQKLSVTAQLEPIRDLKIDITVEKTFSKEYTELYKDTLTSGGSNPRPLNPYADGGFNISYVAAYTMFRKTDPNIVSSTFEHFEASRPIIANRVAQSNPYWINNGKNYLNGYPNGYGSNSQDVLIPAFIAAYTGRNPSKIPLINENYKSIKTNPFAGLIPLPNWRISYNGLSKLPALAPYFSSINITHGYTGNLSMNSFTSALNYADTSRFSAPSFYDTVTHNYVPFYVVPNVTIAENFGPLIGIDATTKSLINVKFEYKKSRTLSLSLLSDQLSETNSSEFVIGAGYKIKGLKLPFEIPGMSGKKKLQNDLTFRLDYDKRNDQTTNSTIDQANTYGTGGQKRVTIQPSIEYVMNKRIDAKLFFDQIRTTPFISTSAPTISTRFGLELKVGLGP